MKLIALLCFLFGVCSVSGIMPGISSIFATESVLRTNSIADTSVLTTTKSESVRKCAFICLQNVHCMSYFYRQNSSECRLMTLDTPDTGSWRPGPGWRYYNVYDISCPHDQGYLHNRGLSLCYQYFRGPANAHDANLTCHENGGQLLKIDNLDKQHHLKSVLGFYPEELVYIQGSDSVQEGEWRYDNGQKLTYFYWSPTSPFGHDLRDSLVLKKSDSYGWSEVDGTLTGGFLCERNMS